MSRAWMPMYWGDYLADTHHFSTAQHGAYLLLIAYYWCNGGLPNDEEEIRKIAKCSPLAWSKISSIVRTRFDTQWRHKRIDIELAKAIEKSRVNSANAKRKHESVADVSPIHSQSHSDSQEKKEREDAANAASYAFEDGVIRLSEKDFLKWKTSFSSLDLSAELLGLSKWAAEQPNWFHAVKGTLAKRNREAIAKGKSNGHETDKERHKRRSREALEKLRAFGEGRSDGDIRSTTLQLLPRAGIGSGARDFSGGSSGSFLPLSNRNRTEGG